MTKFFAVLAVCFLVGCAGKIAVLPLGLGDGRVEFDPAETPCGPDRLVCNRRLPKNTDAILEAMPLPGSRFVAWDGDCTGPALTCTVRTDRQRRVEAIFEPTTAIPAPSAADLTGSGMQAFLQANPSVNWSGAKFLAAIGAVPGENYLDNWIFMVRSDSLQTAHAKSPRLLLPNGTATRVFAMSLASDPAWPGADPDVVEYMEWDASQKKFRFHEIELATRTVHIDDPKCQQCHAGRPNWDSYDFWGGMLPFNRDRIYKGSVEAAAMRKILNLWEEKPESMRSILQLLNLPVGGTPSDPLISRVTGGGGNHGTVKFQFDDDPVTVVEAPISDWNAADTVSVDYPATQPASDVVRDGDRITLKSNPPSGTDQGRGVDLFDRLTPLNAERIAQELIDFPRTPIDVRPIALAILECGAGPVQTTVGPIRFGYLENFNRRSALSLIGDTRSRRERLPQLKVDEENETLSGTFGLWRAYSATVPRGGGAATVPRLRQEVFRRIPNSGIDTITNFASDRERYSDDLMFDFRFYLEPLGVPVDKWSMSVGGRSRTYTFADLFNSRVKPVLTSRLKTNLGITGNTCTGTFQNTLAAEFNKIPSPSSAAAPPYSRIQAIFDRNCLQCHGMFTVNGVAPVPPLLTAGQSHNALTAGPSPEVIPGNPGASRLIQRLTSTAIPMPPSNDGPPLSGAHIRMIERWIQAGALP